MKSWAILLFSVLTACKSSTDVNVPVHKDPFSKLSEYRLFKGEMARLDPNDRVLPYDLNSALFTDYAHKARFVWMPEGKAAQFSENDVLDFPVGTVLVKNFFYELDERSPDKGRKIIETRLLIRKEKEWEANTYVWNDAQTEAFLEIAGESVPVSFTNLHGEQLTFKYAVPNKNQCKSCHNSGNVLIPIGPKVRNINKLYAYGEGSQNQLDKWTEMGYLEGYTPSGATPKMAVWDDPNSGNIEARAKAYLEINCGHCHTEKGPANTSGLFLTTLNTDLTRWGICKSPVAAGRGSGGRSVDIMPGHPDASILLFRMDSDDPGIMMPELGRKLIHKEAVQLIREWIAGMEEHKCGFQ